MTPTEELHKRLDELGIEWWQRKGHTCWNVKKDEGIELWRAWVAPDGTITLKADAIYGFTPEQAVAATVGKGKAKAHPWGYESDTGFFDMTRCECGETNDISARYCNQCGREIQLDMSVIEYAEDYTPQRTCKVNADGTLTSLRDGKTYVDAATISERTCHCTTPDDAWCFSCSSCGKSFPRSDLHIAHNHGEINYCPNCGAKAVSE